MSYPTQAMLDARPDMTNYLIHWTRTKWEDKRWIPPFEILKRIIECGYLKPTLAVRPRWGNPTIKGPHAAVCYTEQPVGAFIKSCKADPSRYFPYGVAVHKWCLYRYRGRPVIYGDGDYSRLINTKLKLGEEGYEEGKEIYKGGLDKELQYLVTISKS